jgi:opine dehydrogenase
MQCSRVRFVELMRRPLVTLRGGGNGTHVAAPLLASKGCKVNIFTRRPQIFADKLDLELADGTSIKDAPINAVSADPREVIPEADIVMIFSPVSAYEPILHSIAPHVKKA